MGLTIHYQLKAPAGSGRVEVQRLMSAANCAAWRRTGRKGFRAGGWEGWDAERRRLARRWRTVPLPGEHTNVLGLCRPCHYELEIEPVDGWMFAVDVGKGCEPLWVGLCRYPASVPVPSRLAVELGPEDRRRTLRTGLAGGWYYRGFAKTQFASLHGWEHFRSCHVGIIEFLAELKTLGWGVRLNDEADYWPRRSVAALRVQLDQMNGRIAAVAGALKDLDGETGGANRIQSPIFAHPGYEHLEAQGAADARRLADL